MHTRNQTKLELRQCQFFVPTYQPQRKLYLQEKCWNDGWQHCEVYENIELSIV